MRGYLENRYKDALDAEGPILLGGIEYDSSDVFKVYAPNDYEAKFTEWLADHKTAVRQRVSEELESNGCLPRFNRLAEKQLNQQILPFVGAGMSKPLGFVMWRQFIEDVARIDLACTIIDSLHHWFAVASEDEVRDHWKANDALLGTTQKFIHNNAPHTGKVLSIDPLKNIRMQTAQGEIDLPVEQTRLITETS